MTLNLLKKNVPSVMAMALAMVSMITPIDAKKSKSNQAKATNKAKKSKGAPARTLVLSQRIGDYQYTCHTDDNNNPYNDCFNSMAKICNTTDPTWNSGKKTMCHTVLNSIFDGMNSDWKNVRKECGQWPFTQNGINYTGSITSSTCKNANGNLIAKGFFTGSDGVKVSVTLYLTDYLGLRFWGNPVLQQKSIQDSTYPECSSVIESWNKMGKTTDVSSTSSTACCKDLVYSNGTIRTQTSGILGVKCNSTGIVTAINWKSKGLTGAIPPEIGNLTDLLELDLSSNQLVGNVPSSLGDLSDLKKLNLSHNSFLNGTFRASCQTTALNVSNTTIIPCGCLAGSTPANKFPPRNTSDECLAERLIGKVETALREKTLAFSQRIGVYQYTCHTDDNKNPYADCLDSMAIICNKTDQQMCHNAVDQIFEHLNTHWQKVLKACVQWNWKNEGNAGSINEGNAGSITSSTCKNAKDNLIAKGFYTRSDGVKVPVTSDLTESLAHSLWGNPVLKGRLITGGDVSGLKLKKRTLTTSLVYSEIIGVYYYACRVDKNYNPMQDCLNLIAKICYGDASRCKSVVDSMFDGLNSHWKNVRIACGKWKWKGLNDGNPSSTACATANKDLKEQAYYISNANTVSSIDDSVTESMKQIWDNFQ